MATCPFLTSRWSRTLSRHFLGIRSHEIGAPNWLDHYCPLSSFPGNYTCAGDNAIWRRYVISLYFTTTTMTSTGYGDVLPVTDEGTVTCFSLTVHGRSEPVPCPTRSRTCESILS